jgi:hypothetical protein
MEKDIKYVILQLEETVAESIYKDIITGITVAFCVYISQDNTFWTFVTGFMALVYLFNITAEALKKQRKFRTKKDLQTWVDSL